MADAYPAFDFRRNDNPGSGSGPMGGPGAFAPGNTPVVYGRNQSPLDGFMQAIGVSKVENGQAYGTTGGMVHMWDSDRQGFQALAAAQQEQEARQRPQAAQQQPAAAPTNTFLPGAPTATGDVRFNYGPMGAPPQEPLAPLQRGNINLNQRPRVANPAGGTSTLYSMSFGTDKGEVLVPRVSEDGRIMSEQEAIDAYRKTGRMLGVFASPEDATRYADYLHNDQVYRGAPTPMVGRDYGVPAGGATAPVGGFGALAKEISLADGPVKRNGALFSYDGAGNGFSITQDPNTIPTAITHRSAPSNQDAAALAYRGLSAGMDRATFQQLLAQQGATPSDVSLSPMEQAARARRQAELSAQALAAYDRVANAGLAKTGNQTKEVQAGRDQTFLKMLGLDKAPIDQAAATGQAKVDFSKSKDLYGIPKKDNPPTYIEYLDMRDQIEAKGDKATPQEKKRLKDLNAIITKMQTQSDVFGTIASVIAGGATGTPADATAW